MIIRQIRSNEQKIFNQVVNHPLQSWEWGAFRRKIGQEVERIGFFEEGKLKTGLQIFFKPIPILTDRTAGYCPKADKPTEDQLDVLKQIGKKHNSIFIKLEPNYEKEIKQINEFKPTIKLLKNNNSQIGRHLFSKYTFKIDLNQDQDKILANFTSKSRYNTRLAEKKGVKVRENSTPKGLETYIKILEETMKRQNFYAHTPQYFKDMWDILNPSGMMKIFESVYKDQVLASWIVFLFNNVLYYPYGASRNIHREVMASNLMVWELIKYGKKHNCHTFDLWGCLGPNPNPKHRWFGFHRFKKSFGGTLMQSIGTYDLILDIPFYKMFTLADNARWKLLRIKAKLNI